MTEMTTAEFLAARYDEEEAAAKAACDRDSGKWLMGRKWNVYRAEDITPFDDDETNQLVVYGNMESQSRHIARWDPARVLADIASKRVLLAYLAHVAEVILDNNLWSLEGESDHGLRLLAAPYAAHPDYDPAWAVE